MYVACTRAKDTLDLFVPLSLYSRSSGGQEPASPSPFIRELSTDTLDEIYENYGGALSRRRIKEVPQSAPAFGGSFSREHRRSWHWNEDGEEETNSFRRRRKNDDDDWPPRDRDFDASPRSREDADDAYMAAVRDALRSGRELEESPDAKPVKKKLGFCRHRLFGRGKIVEEIPPDKYRVNFPGLGLKIILADYLTLE